MKERTVKIDEGILNQEKAYILEECEMLEKMFPRDARVYAHVEQIKNSINDIDFFGRSYAEMPKVFDNDKMYSLEFKGIDEERQFLAMIQDMVDDPDDISNTATFYALDLYDRIAFEGEAEGSYLNTIKKQINKDVPWLWEGFLDCFIIEPKGCDN